MAVPSRRSILGKPGPGGEAMIRVGICDDLIDFRRTLSAVVDRAADMSAAAVCASGAEALTVDTPVDVWLMDLLMPGMNGREVCRRMIARDPLIKVLFITAFPGNEVMNVLADGAVGYIHKDIAGQDLHQAIRAAAAGLSVSSSSAMRSALTNAGLRPSAELTLDPDAELTGSDREILQRLVAGETLRTIADGIHMSESGLKKRLDALARKLGVKGRTQLTVQAIRLGLA